MRKSLVLAVAAAAVSGIALAAPASAVTCTDAELAAGTCTNVTATVVDGTLSIKVTPAATGSSGTVTSSLGALADINLGATLVSDTRLSSTGWVAKATASQFTPAIGSATAIPAANASFYVNPTGTVPGLATLAYPDGSASTGSNAPAANGANLVTATSTAAPGAVTYVPMLRLSVPAGQPGGAYAGTVTQSVS